MLVLHIKSGAWAWTRVETVVTDNAATSRNNTDPTWQAVHWWFAACFGAPGKFALIWVPFLDPGPVSGLSQFTLQCTIPLVVQAALSIKAMG